MTIKSKILLPNFNLFVQKMKKKTETLMEIVSIEYSASSQSSKLEAL